MIEEHRKVDVFDRQGRLLKTYGVNLIAINYAVTEEEFLEQALAMAEEEGLVPEDELDGLVARKRVD